MLEEPALVLGLCSFWCLKNGRVTRVDESGFKVSAKGERFPERH
jgi:hypothetical protein